MLGPVVFLLFGFVDWFIEFRANGSAFLDREAIRGIIEITAYGCLFGLPSLVVLWVAAFFICGKSLSARAQRWWIAAVAIPLTLGPVVFVIGKFIVLNWVPVALVGVSYYLAVLGGIFFYQLPQDEAVVF